MENIVPEEINSVSSWLNMEFFKEILSKERNMDISVTDINVKAAVPKGDNYMSTLYRISVQFVENKNAANLNSLSFIVKILPDGEFLQKFLHDIKGMEKELQIYGTTLPSMYRILSKKFPNRKEHTLSPRSFLTTRSNTIILEDLQHLGYKMANRRNGLDLEHCKMALRALARFHATSLALYKIEPSSMDTYGEEMFQESGERRETMQSYIENNLKNLSSEIEKWAGYEHYAEKIKNLIPTAIDRMIGTLKPKKGSFNVLNHGDFWVNNIMFRYWPDTGKVQDVKFVDFQIARFSSPVLDLQYFLCTSPSFDIRFQYREHLLEVYHVELCDIMRQLDLDPEQFTLLQLKEEFEEKEIFGLLTACNILCTVLADQSDAPEYSDVKEADLKSGEVKMMGNAYSGRRFRKVFERMLLHYDSKGLF